MSRRGVGQGLHGRECNAPASLDDIALFRAVLSIGVRPFEVFTALFLDARHHLILAEDLFRGSVAQTSVYPREVARRCLQINASAVVLAHNHPSGAVQPSQADRELTRALVAALALVDVRVLDHLVVTRVDVYSFAEHGLL
ncbi:MAG: hypothetical protein EBT40_06025 [Betaproteobacteria bacterium]|nr:hypothetical protein [Betaproteobacteria bacterium]